MTKDCFKMIMKILNTIRTIIYINLNYCDISQIDGSMIINSLKENQLLRVLDISKNKIGDAGALALAELLNILNSLMEVNMIGNEITSKAGSEIGKILKTNRTLINIDLTYNKIDDDGILIFADLLKITIILKIFNLSRNCFTDKSAIALIAALKENNSIIYLDISINDITDDVVLVQNIERKMSIKKEQNVEEENVEEQNAEKANVESR
ncbi:unnamed protein product [Didymodactylos carnosus]|uniref:Uncharacterized protein n=1 Tax=Didymodactylos carnosus TaxID=1234261 RepID=A0A815X546_9BILA|nr:unnamed protein product [Didymodactylos carnosus]CAF4412393.1 unnamed protein product [Didymodactylos carnosus]